MADINSNAWNGAPNGTMTNGFVQPTGTVAQHLPAPAIQASWVKYPQGEKRIVIPANAHVL
jgi:hypothetical protein